MHKPAFSRRLAINGLNFGHSGHNQIVHPSRIRVEYSQIFKGLRMKLCQGLLYGLLALLAATFGVSRLTAAPAASSGWHTDFAAAEAAARELNRPLLIHFHASYCGPCHRMDAEVLNSQELQQIFSEKVVGVKVDIEQHPALAQRFRVRSIPNDVIVGPDGKVLHKMEGYQAKGVYLATLGRLEPRGRHGTHIAQAAPTAVAPAKPAGVPAQGAGSAPARAPASASKLTSAAKVTSPAAVLLDQPDSVRGLDGYCPVTLWKSRKWIRGQAQFSAEHHGQTYYFLGSKERDEFAKDPAQYAPQLLGCDPVVLWDTERAIAGTARFGAYYDGELFLFDSLETRKRFRENPPKYTQTRHVLKVGASERK